MLCGYFEFESKAAWPLLDSLPDTMVLELRRSRRLIGTADLVELVIA